MDSEIAQIIADNLKYWLDVCERHDAASLAELDAARHNIAHAISMGWRVDYSVTDAARLVAQLHPLVEQRGYQLDWRPMVEQAIVHTDTQSDLHWVLQNQLGHLYRLDQNWQAAEQIHQRVLSQNINQIEQAKAHFHLGNIYRSTHSYNEARVYSMQALSCFQQLELDAQALGAAHNLAGLIEHSTGNYHAAQQQYNQAIMHWADGNDKVHLARAYMNLGRTLTAVANYIESLQAFDNALAHLVGTMSDLDRVRIHLNRGVAFYQMAELDSAENAFREANSSYLQQSGNQYLLAYTHHNLGSLLFEQGQLDEAELLLRESIVGWRQLDNIMLLGDGLGTLAQVQHARGNQAEAQQLIQQAIETLAAVEENAWAAEKNSELRACQAHWLQMGRAE